MNESVSTSVRDMIRNFDRLEKEREESKLEMSKMPVEVREFVRSELTSIAEILRNKQGYSIPQIRRILREILEVPV